MCLYAQEAMDISFSDTTFYKYKQIMGLTSHVGDVKTAARVNAYVDLRNAVSLCAVLQALFEHYGMDPRNYHSNYETNELYFLTDAGRLIRPIYYISNGKISYDRKDMLEMLSSNNLSWQQLVCGIKQKPDGFNYQNNIHSYIELLF